eukprot:204977-Pleurochrysis_carterae.AAC.2
MISLLPRGPAWCSPSRPSLLAGEMLVLRLIATSLCKLPAFARSHAIARPVSARARTAARSATAAAPAALERIVWRLRAL